MVSPAHLRMQTGVLSLPSVLQTLGIVPGTITLITVGALSTCESRSSFLVVTYPNERDRDVFNRGNVRYWKIQNQVSSCL